MRRVEVFAVLLLFLTLSGGPLCAQNFCYPSGLGLNIEGDGVDTSRKDNLSLKVDAVAFFRDAEFFLPYVEGYTASGFRLMPALCYRINDRAEIRGGLILTTVAGTEGVRKAQPVFSIEYRPWQPVSLVMGTIDGSVSHALGEPMYDLERWLYDYKEDGIQLRTDFRYWKSDTWLNWENFLDPWTPDQERFTLGTNQEFYVLKTRDDRHLVLNTTFMGCHRGGQFSSLDTCIETLFNESLSLRWEQHFLNGRDLARLEMPIYLFQNQSPQGERYTAYDRGWGVYPNAEIRASGFHSSSNLYLLRCGYWYGDQYLSARGSYLFQSVSWHDEGYVKRIRHLVTAALGFKHEYKNLSLDANAQFYYDPDYRKLDFAVGLNLVFKGRFRLL